VDTVLILQRPLYLPDLGRSFPEFTRYSPSYPLFEKGADVPAFHARPILPGPDFCFPISYRLSGIQNLKLSKRFLVLTPTSVLFFPGGNPTHLPLIVTSRFLILCWPGAKPLPLFFFFFNQEPLCQPPLFIPVSACRGDSADLSLLPPPFGENWKVQTTAPRILLFRDVSSFSACFPSPAPK